MTASLKQQLPVLARHEGVWDGNYRYYDPSGEQIDAHRSRLLCRFVDEHTYHQTNYYYWSDGREDIRDFPSKLEQGRLVFYTDIDGWAADEPLDTHGRTVLLNWTRKEDPSLYLYEMIQISDCGTARARTWHWFKDDRLFQRTLIDERRVSTDWRAYDNKSYTYDEIAVDLKS